MDILLQRHAIVTGGSLGIGLATVRRLQADGLTVNFAPNWASSTA